MSDVRLAWFSRHAPEVSLASIGESASSSYLPGAKIPVGSWSACGVIDPAEWDPSRDVAVVQLPPPLFEPDLDCSALAPFLVCDDGLELRGTRIDPPNLATTTVGACGRFTGLHVDDWDSLRPSEKYLARNRICVNLGSETRYFLFVPISVAEMARRLSTECADHGHSLAMRYLDEYPRTAVVRVSIPPRHGYIAPTENLVHDGSTLGTKSPDVTLGLLGRFAPAPLLQAIAPLPA